MNYEKVKKLPKIELHCHLDGSISPETFKKIAYLSDYPLPESNQALLGMLHAPKYCSNLQEYLTRFDAVIDCLQTIEALKLAAYDLVQQAAIENVIYIEVRFAPMFSTKKGLSCDEVVAAVLEGLKKGNKDFGVESTIILCTMRGQDENSNKMVIKTAETFKNSGVGGIDLAGNEAAYPPEEFSGIFKIIKNNDLPITIHAGECGNADNISASILLGATRIGHGIAMKDDPSALQTCLKNNIVVEMCPTCNLQTKAAENWENYPFMHFLDSGINVCINTDNRTVSNTTLTDEYMLLDKQYDLNYSIMKKTTLNALFGAFITNKKKEQLMEKIQRAYAEIELSQ